MPSMTPLRGDSRLHIAINSKVCSLVRPPFPPSIPPHQCHGHHYKILKRPPKKVRTEPRASLKYKHLSNKERLKCTGIELAESSNAFVKSVPMLEA